MVLLNPFRPGILWKIGVQKNKERTFKRLYLQSWGKFRVKINVFRKLIEFSSSQGCFLHALPTWVHDRGVSHLQPLVPLSSSCRVEGVNDEPAQVLGLLFFASFTWKWGYNFEKLRFFTFRPKHCFCLTHSAREHFERLAFTYSRGYCSIIMEGQTEFFLFSVKLGEHIFSADSVCTNPCEEPLPRIKIWIFWLSIFLDKLISPPISTLLLVHCYTSTSSTTKIWKTSISIKCNCISRIFILIIIIIFSKLAAPNKQFSSVGRLFMLLFLLVSKTMQIWTIFPWLYVILSFFK